MHACLEIMGVCVYLRVDLGVAGHNHITGAVAFFEEINIHSKEKKQRWKERMERERERRREQCDS